MKSFSRNYLYPLAIACFCLPLSGCENNSNANQFSIMTSDLSGKSIKTLVSDSHREINHADVTPDNQSVVFSRFNKKNLSGVALEGNGYDECELVKLNLSDNTLDSLTPSKKGIVACAGNLSSDGKRHLYVSTDNPKRQAEIIELTLNSGQKRRLNTPPEHQVADPHEVGNQIVFTVIDTKPNTVWLMNKDGSNARQITFPTFGNNSKSDLGVFQAGDFDPKLSPDGSKVAFMRHYPDNPLHWHTLWLDLKTTQVYDLSESGVMDAVPEWSPDSKTLIFFHLNLKEPSAIGLYTVNINNPIRKKIPLPPGYFYSQPSFLPNDPNHIIFTAHKT